MRTATLNDIEEVISMERDILEEDKELMTEEYRQFRMTTITSTDHLAKLEKKYSVFLVATEPMYSRIVGVARGSKEPGGVFNLEFIGVKEEFRGKGIGSRLLEEVEKIVRKKGVHKITIQVYPDPVYTAFFEQHGFTKEGVLRNHIFHQDLDIFSKHVG